MRKIFFLLAVAVIFFSSASETSALVVNKKVYRNGLTQKEWIKYGVNPWSLDTDNDGQPDKWEVKNKYCPTNPDQYVKIGDSACVKGKINFSTKIYTPPAVVKAVSAREVKKFASCAEMRAVVSSGQFSGIYNMIAKGQVAAPVATFSTPSAAVTETNSVDYSSTNIQVEGVDESDTVKTDGNYIYNVAGGYLHITQTAQKGEIKLLSKTSLNKIQTVHGIYLSKDYVMVLGTASFQDDLVYENNGAVATTKALPTIFPRYFSYTVAEVWNVQNRANPTLARSVEFDGSLLGSRLTNGYAYLILKSLPPYRVMGASTSNAATSEIMPIYRDRTGKSLANEKIDFKPVVACASVDYITPIYYTNYLQVVALPLTNPMGKIGEKVILGGGDKLYMSEKNLYVLAPNYDFWWRTPDKSGSRESTEVYKFTLDKDKIEFYASQSVPGTVLNQFSVDEYKGVLRIATSQRQAWNIEDGKSNNLYFFDKDLNRIGWYEGWGRGEKIYAARFMGDRVYVVTFKETDPLFVFDVSNPYATKYLGQLDIPGYSNYLHPYDATHLVGIGKNATTNENQPGFAWYQGMKVALFDVTDPTDPKEMYKTEIGDRGTNSPALTDHHAFLFSRSKNLLAFPVLVAQLTAAQKAATSTPAHTYGANNFQGLYAYHLSLDDGFRLIGSVTHFGTEPGVVDNYYGPEAISRSLYIGDNLYVLSDAKLTVHRLEDMSLVKEVRF